jgi:hypothetical protein
LFAGVAQAYNYFYFVLHDNLSRAHPELVEGLGAILK